MFNKDNYEMEKEMNEMEFDIPYKDNTVCILENGTLCEYDVACILNMDYFFTLDEFKFLGKGKIHSVNGILEKDNTKYNFFIRIK